MSIFMTKIYGDSFTPDWVADSTFYQIFPDRFFNGAISNDHPGVEPWGNPPTRENFFGGDLRGILRKTGYLQDLGINALYLNPVFKAKTNHKYDTSDYFEIDPVFGSNELFGEFVDELHNRGMRIILDGVFNHCGDGFKAFVDFKNQGEKSPYSDWFIPISYPIREDPPSYYTCGGASDLPKFNIENPEVQNYILKVAAHWLKHASIDGWRLDCPSKIPLGFWRKFREVVKEVNPQAYLVGEVWRDAGPWIQGDIFDGVTNYRLRELILGFCSSGILDAEDFAYEVGHLLDCLGAAAPSMLNLLGCHDTARVLTVFNGEVKRLLIAIVFQMTTIGAPMIYYGDEVGMLGDTDPDCRRTMVWDENLWNQPILQTYKQLIQLRMAHQALRRGRLLTLLTVGRVYAYKREYEDDEIIVLLNPGIAAHNMTITINSKAEKWRDVFRGKEIAASNGSLLFENIGAFSFVVLTPVQN